MNSQTKSTSSLDAILSIILRIGLTLSLIAVFIGGCLFLWSHAHTIIDDRVFHGEPLMLKGIKEIVEVALHLDLALAIAQLGILILIVTPMIRVFSCLILFAKERDVLYTGLSMCVLAVLLFSFFY